jgi:hypothetical protein
MNRRGLGRGGPGLIGTAARTAVIAGTATAVSGNVARRQQQRAAQPAAPQGYEQAPPAAAPAPPQVAPAAAPSPMTEDVIAQLRELAELRDQGILTDEEFAAQKARLLA